jgi:hypothetical protein
MFKQIVRVTTGLLNTVNDAVAGGSVASGTGANPYAGQLGAIAYFGPSDIRFDSSIGTLYEGWYQYVQFLVSGGAPARGLMAFWSDLTNFVVTMTAVNGQHAGVVLNSVTAGQYGWIQISGLASVKFANSITKATPAVKDLVLTTDGANTCDILADATAITSPTFKRVVGVAASTAPVGGAISLVELFQRVVLPS